MENLVWSEAVVTGEGRSQDAGSVFYSRCKVTTPMCWTHLAVGFQNSSV